MRSLKGLLIITGLMLLLDIYVYQGLKSIFAKSPYRRPVLFGYKVWCVLEFAVLFGILLLGKEGTVSPSVRSFLLFMIVGLFFARLVTAVFFLIDDVRRLLKWGFIKSTQTTRTDLATSSVKIKRSVFLSWIGFAAGGSLFGTLTYGFSNRYNYMVKRERLAFSNLPDAFKGLRIVHISDIHSGSLHNISEVRRGIQMVLQEKPDLILFTGDLVNDRAEEVLPLKEVLSELKAPLGVYSVLGNHDYGDYAHWPYKGVTKEENRSQLLNIQKELGWKMLLNEHVLLEKEGAKIALIGVENWSNKSNFPAYGKLDIAYEGTAEIPFKILMSHDPSHWDAQVRPLYPSIDLMLSGHTHGMQFGLETPGMKWSPVQYLYKQWAGLYENGHQKLYVNRGFGFIGYPGRVGILPEITVLELV